MLAGPIANDILWPTSMFLGVQLLVAGYAIGPLHFQNDLNSFLGSGFSVKPTLSKSAPFRPLNESRGVR